MEVFVETYEDDTCCVRFNGRGTRITRKQARELLQKLQEAIEDLDARAPSDPSDIIPA